MVLLGSKVRRSLHFLCLVRHARTFVAAVWLVRANHVLLRCFLQVLGQVVNMRLQVFMNCRAKLSELPLKR